MTPTDKTQLLAFITADIKIIARKTELWDMEYCDKVISDLSVLVSSDYLSVIHIILNNDREEVIRANKYVLEANPVNQRDLPGGNDWDNLGGTKLIVVLSYTEKWHKLDYSSKNLINRQELKIDWYPSSTNLSFPNLKGVNNKKFSSANYSIKRTDFK